MLTINPVSRLGADREGGVLAGRWENRNMANTETNVTTSKLRDRYYAMLTENEVWQLYTFYQKDFELFEYEVDPKYLIKFYSKKQEQ